ncbi:MAG: MC/SLC25 family protein, partial [Allorhizobium sp.]
DTFKDMVRKPGQTSLGVNQLVLAGTTAGLFQQLITYPLEVVRTRLSLGYYSGITDCFVNSIKAEGMSSMCVGQCERVAA